MPVGEPLTGHDGAVLAITSFTTSEGLTLLASGGEDATLRVWNPMDAAFGQPLTGHTGAVLAVTSFTTGEGQRLLASGSQDATLRIWDPAMASEVFRLVVGGPVCAVVAVIGRKEDRVQGLAFASPSGVALLRENVEHAW
jgi:WD40 repeat protein